MVTRTTEELATYHETTRDTEFDGELDLRGTDEEVGRLYRLLRRAEGVRMMAKADYEMATRKVNDLKEKLADCE